MHANTKLLLNTLADMSGAERETVLEDFALQLQELNGDVVYSQLKQFLAPATGFERLTRPGDVFLPTYSKAKGMVLDFAVTHAQQTKYRDKVRNASWVAAGSFAEHYATEKRVYQRLEAEQPWIHSRHEFTAMVVES